MDEERKLSEADTAAIVAELKKALLQDLYVNAGKGVIAWIKKGFFTLILLAALYATAHDQGWIGAFTAHARGGQ